MDRKLSDSALRYLEDNHETLIALTRELCGICAPSNHEERRAEFCCRWLKNLGTENVYIDEALNVILPIGCEGSDDITIFMAHIDTVFPDTEPMPLREENGRLYCPGVGDDTVNVAMLMLIAKYLLEQRITPSHGIVFAMNSGEEGLGNLAGCKAIMRDFAPRVKAFLSLDDQSTHVCARAVGSARYRITAETRGGHSFADFGARNAVEVLSRLVCALYRQHVPRAAGSLTTYNVGVISGGTSVNAIAQRAEMLYEYRSNDAQCMAMMKEKLDTILRESTMPDAKVTLKLLGERPCGAAGDPPAQRALETRCIAALERYVGGKKPIGMGSTDCNIPLSLGIPSASFGMYRGGGAHTREEWMEPSSLYAGMKAAACVLMHWFSL